MNYKQTYFEVDPMVIFKQSTPQLTQVVRLDDDYVLEFEGHLSMAWKLLADRKPLMDLLAYFVNTCGQLENEAEESLKELTAILAKEKLGQLITIKE